MMLQWWFKIYEGNITGDGKSPPSYKGEEKQQINRIVHTDLAKDRCDMGYHSMLKNE